MRVSDFRFLVESLADFADDEIVTIQAVRDVRNENEPAYSVGYQWSGSDNKGCPAKDCGPIIGGTIVHERSGRYDPRPIR